MEAIVETRDLAKSYKRRDAADIQAVKGIDLKIYKGEIFSLLGPNGAGKTTTISMISGLIEPTRGDAWIGGHSITHEPIEAKKLIGVIPQEVALYPMLTARQNLSFFGRMYDMHGQGLNKRIDEILDFLDLRDRQNDPIDTFSGGMKRRVNIAVGLLHRPQLVYMDEPTVGIDPQNRRRILDTVFRLRDEYGLTILYTTHLMEEAQELSDRVGIIDHGEIIALGTQGELTQQVGEEDRLIFSIGAQTVSQDVQDRILNQVESVTRVIYQDTPHDVGAVDGNDGAVEAEIIDTARAVTRKAQKPESTLTVYAKRGRRALSHIVQIINEAGIDIYSVEVREPDLEAVFLHLTGRALRD